MASFDDSIRRRPIRDLALEAGALHEVSWARADQGLLVKLQEALDILGRQGSTLSRFKVRSLSIFGSVARDEGRPDSDIDLLVEFSQPIGIFDFMELKELLETALGRRVDLSTLQALKRQMRERILREAIRAA